MTMPMGIPGIEISDSDFIKLSRLIYQHSGIKLNANKKSLVRARLQKRIRECGLSGFKEYHKRVLEDSSGAELIHLLDAISTNQTYFLREAEHFNYLMETILPRWQQSDDRSPKHLWSAGCSSGEEPYTLAMVLSEFYSLAKLRGKVKISATDINSQVLEHARQGIYPESRLEKIPSGWVKKYFQKGVNRWAGSVRVKAEVRQLVDFFRLNLMEPFPFRQPLDIIFCRNVMIYFDKTTQEQLVQRFSQTLKPGGYLFLGHSESLAGVSHRLTYVKPTIYQK